MNAFNTDLNHYFVGTALIENRSEHYERRMFRVISILGLIRSIIAVVVDLYLDQGPEVMAVNLVFTALFGISILGHHYFQSLHFPSLFLSIGLYLLTVMTWVMSQGISGSTTFTMIAVLIGSVMILDKKSRLVVMPCMWTGVIMLVTIEFWWPQYYTIFPQLPSASVLPDIVLTTLVIFLMINYLKNNVEAEQEELNKVKVELAERRDVLSRQQIALQREHENLLATQLLLESRVEDRSIKLDAKMNALQSYVRLNSDHLDEPLDDIVKILNDLALNDDKEGLMDKLRFSGNELRDVVQRIRHNVSKHNFEQHE